MAMLNNQRVIMACEPSWQQSHHDKMTNGVWLVWRGKSMGLQTGTTATACWKKQLELAGNWTAFVDYLPFNIFQPFRKLHPWNQWNRHTSKKKTLPILFLKFLSSFSVAWDGMGHTEPSHSRNADVSTSFKRGLPGPIPLVTAAGVNPLDPPWFLGTVETVSLWKFFGALVGLKSTQDKELDQSRNKCETIQSCHKAYIRAM